MQSHWFYTVWPFIGVGGAIVMVAILLMTDTFRGNASVSRWRDPVWLAWQWNDIVWVQKLLALNCFVLILHRFEEYAWPGGCRWICHEVLTPKPGDPPDRYPLT